MSDLTRITANLTPRALAALDRLCATTGDNRTDALNRAVQVAALLADMSDGRGVFTVLDPDGQPIRVCVP